MNPTDNPPSAASSPPLPPEPRGRVLLRVGLPAVFAMGWWSVLCASPFICVSAFLSTGAIVETCPSGDLVQVTRVAVDGVARNQAGVVTVEPSVVGRTDRNQSIQGHPWRFSADVKLRRSGSETLESFPEVDHDPWDGDWEDTWNGRGQQRRIQLPPDLPDGVHTLVVHVGSRIAEETVELDIPVFAPAVANLLTDRPRYEAGNTVLFRAVVLRAADLSPLEHRPGRLKVRDPDGTVVMDEPAQTGDWGVVAGSMPLAASATEGTWTARWESGSDSVEAQFVVAPFTLPRFAIETAADQSWYVAGDSPRVLGSATYASGAPVADADVDLSWRLSGAWPMPNDWQSDGLPRTARTDRRGTFTVDLPQIPDDLVGKATLIADVSVVDPSGDRQQSAVSVLLSADAIAGELVTETGDTLLEGFNNRAWVRLTRPDGSPLRDVSLQVRRQWDAADPGTTVLTDADGVARLQLDPGSPVNLELPTPPIRPTPPPEPVTLSMTRDRLANQNATLGDRRAMEIQQASLGACARWVQHGSNNRVLVLDVRASGAVADALVDGGTSSLDRACLQDAARRMRFPSGADRMLEQALTLSAQDLPTIGISVDGVPATPAEVSGLWEPLLPAARACLSADQRSSGRAHVLRWRMTQGTTAVRVGTIHRAGLTESAARCIESTLNRATLPKPATADALGLLVVSTTARPSRISRRPSPRTMLGYALELTATVDNEKLGTTTLHVSPGTVPAMRLRASPVVARAKETITVELLRGPDFSGELGKEYRLTHSDGRAVLTKRAKDSRELRFVLPDDAHGWWTIAAHGAQARVYVPGDDVVDVALTPNREAYAPGDEAILAIRTTRSGKGVPAAVGLIGVDESLAQIAALPGADTLAALRPAIQTTGLAFGALDAAALGRGMIRGENAREAVILKVSQVPGPAALDRPVSADTTRSFSPEVVLISRFYTVLAELQKQVRHWERTAPPKDHLTAQKTAALWAAAVDTVEARGEPVVDAFNRRLRLHLLPGDLLALTDPRSVAIDGTRLPEDVENWTAFVVKEQP